MGLGRVEVAGDAWQPHLHAAWFLGASILLDSTISIFVAAFVLVCRQRYSEPYLLWPAIPKFMQLEAVPPPQTQVLNRYACSLFVNLLHPLLPAVLMTHSAILTGSLLRCRKHLQNNKNTGSGFFFLSNSSLFSTSFLPSPCCNPPFPLLLQCRGLISLSTSRSYTSRPCINPLRLTSEKVLGLSGILSSQAWVGGG